MAKESLILKDILSKKLEKSFHSFMHSNFREEHKLPKLISFYEHYVKEKHFRDTILKVVYHLGVMCKFQKE